MSKLIKVLGGVALVVYFFALVIVKIPATFVTANVVKMVPTVQLAVISGTAWAGRAADAHLNIRGQLIDLGSLKWTFQPLSLLSLKACVDLESAVFSGNVCRSITGMNTLKNVQVDLPVGVANQSLRDVKLSGVGSLSIAKGAVSDKGEIRQLSGNLTWRGARLNAQGMWFTLGDFAADLSEGANGAIHAKVFDLAGPFGVSLDAEVGLTTPPSMKGNIAPRADASDDIRDVLGLFSIPQDDGSFAVSYPIGS